MSTQCELNVGPPILSLSSRYSDLQWASTGLALHGVFQLAPRSPGGRVVALGASFVAVIVISMYIAAYSAQITVQNLQAAKVTDVSQLYSKPVGIWQVCLKLSYTSICWFEYLNSLLLRPQSLVANEYLGIPWTSLEISSSLSTHNLKYRRA